jgi:hypothetical protein
MKACQFLSFVAVWLIWVMIYVAQRYCPLITRVESEIVQEIRDRIACHNIIANDDLLTAGDAPLFMRVLQIVDFLYYTVLPSLVTVALIYIWPG